MITPLVTGLRFPGYGFPMPARDVRSELSSWARLAQGSALGKKSVLLYNAHRRGRQDAPVSILRVQGNDADALQLTLTLASPLVVPLPFSPLLAVMAQNLTGEQGNSELAARGNFPGLPTPISWPPLEAIVEWGVGGTSARAEVDFLNGTTVNVVASFLEVHAAVGGSPDKARGTSAAYVLSAFVGPGDSRRGVARKTVALGALPPYEESAAIPVPRFARSAYVVGADHSPAPRSMAATLRLWQAPDRTGNVGNVLVHGHTTRAADLPNAAQYVSVLNRRDYEGRFSIVFNLAI